MPASLPNLQPLLPHVVPWALVTFRLAGLFAMTPLLTSAAMPMRHKALLSAMLAAAAYPFVPQSAAMAESAMHADIFGLVPMVLGEMLIGFCVGAIAAVPLLMLEMAGVISGTTMGLGLARVYSPDLDADADLLGQMFFFLGMGIFIAAGGLEGAFKGVLHSFERVPIGAASLAAPLHVFTGVLASGFELGMRVSAPVVGVVMLIIVVMGVLGKTIPQLNTMSVGFTLKILCGLAMLAMGIYAMREPVGEAIRDASDAAALWLDDLAPIAR